MNNDEIKNWKKMVHYPKLGEILLQHKKITIEQFDIGMQKHLAGNHPLGEVLVSLGFITPDELVQVLNLQDNIDEVLSKSIEELESSVE